MRLLIELHDARLLGLSLELPGRLRMVFDASLVAAPGEAQRLSAGVILTAESVLELDVDLQNLAESIDEVIAERRGARIELEDSGVSTEVDALVVRRRDGREIRVRCSAVSMVYVLARLEYGADDGLEEGAPPIALPAVAARSGEARWLSVAIQPGTWPDRVTHTFTRLVGPPTGGGDGFVLSSRDADFLRVSVPDPSPPVEAAVQVPLGSSRALSLTGPHPFVLVEWPGMARTREAAQR